MFAKLDEEGFKLKFKEELGENFKLLPFDFSERRTNPIMLECLVCGRQFSRLFHNTFKSKNCKRCKSREVANKRHEDKWMSKETFCKMLPVPPAYEIIDENINLNRKIRIQDCFGICEVSPRNLLTRKFQSFLQSAVDKTQYRLSMFRSVHGNNFSYTNYQYNVDVDTVDIVCNRCGRKDNVREFTHMKKTSGCKNCDVKLGTPRMSDEEFKKRLLECNPDIEILEDRKGYHTPILCRNKYGLVKVSPGNLLNGSVGSFKSALDKSSYMIAQFTEKHNGRYTYPDYEYCGNRCQAKIYCSSHETFLQSADVHLMGSGCPACAQENKINGFGRTDFVNVCKDREAIFYIIKCYNEQECFYKLGITSRSIKIRYKDKRSMPYNYETTFEHVSSDPSYIWDLELKIKKANKEFSYTPDIYFKGGTTECFTTDLPVQEIIDVLTF